MTERLILDGSLVRRIRLELAMSQRDLAKVAGVRPATVSDAENGAECRLETIRALARALGVKPTDIAKIA